MSIIFCTAAATTYQSCISLLVNQVFHNLCIIMMKSYNMLVSQGPVRYIIVHIHEPKKKKGKRGDFQPKHRKQGMQKVGDMFRGLKCHFSGKGGGFVKIYLNSSVSNPI